MKFCNLKFYSEFSLNKGNVKIHDIVKRARRNKEFFLGISDISNISGSFDFFEYSLNLGIKPILGCELPFKNKFLSIYFSGSIFVIVKNKFGYKKLCDILNSRDKKYKLDIRNIINDENLIILSGGSKGIYSNFLNMNINFLCLLTRKIKEINKNFYIEVQRFNDKSIIESNILFNLSKITKTPSVATNPIRYIKKKDFLLFKFKNCILNKKYFFKNDSYLNKYNNNYYDKNYHKKFLKFKNCILNTTEIAKCCNFRFNKDRKIIFFKKAKQKIFKKKIFNKFNKFIKNVKKCKKKKYRKRFLNEINTIKKMGFLDYFMIVYDFVNWSRKNNISMGPGRGSSSGSLVAYILEITKIDPIKFNLIFERFLNIKKKSLPDFDIDFCKKNREKVIKYIKKKYGYKNVFNIVTFGKFYIRNSIRDSCRILGYGYSYSEKILEILKKFNNLNNLKDFVNLNKNNKKKYLTDIKFRRLINAAYKLDGLIRNIGIHAGGIIIIKKSSNDFFPKYVLKKEGIYVSQFDKKSVEKMGYIKFDILGLNTLTIINNIIKDSKINLNFKNINLKDKKTYNLIKSGNTVGVFQLENYKLMFYLRKIKPKKFNEIVNIISLYRPGPIGLIDNYLKNNNYNNFLNKKSREVLKSTNGIIIFQEQLMELLKINAGYSLNDADIFRSSILKCNDLIIKKLKISFFKKRKKKFNKSSSEKIFNFIKNFSGYSFNKAHAVSYSYITFLTAFLKSNFKSYFYVSNFNLSYNKKEKLSSLYFDCFKNNISIKKPNINESNIYFKYIDEKNINFGLISINGVGKKALKNIFNERKKGNFKNLIDFCCRTERNLVNKRVIENLIYSGCFDLLDVSRFCLIKKLRNILKENYFIKKCFLNQRSFFNKDNIYLSNNKKKKKILIMEKRLVGYFLTNIYIFFKNKIDNILKNNYLNSYNYFYGFIISYFEYNSENYKISIEKDNMCIKRFLISRKHFINKMFNNFVFVYYSLINNNNNYYYFINNIYILK